MNMYIVDDPALALITRFVGDSLDSNRSDADFFRQQVEAIAEYVERFPPDERDMRALVWVEAHARHYRQEWQKQAAIDILAEKRCPDCPLLGGDEQMPCAIHDQWLTLLGRYAANDLSSYDYVEQSLALLTAHKVWLKVSQARQPLRCACPADVNLPSAASTPSGEPPIGNSDSSMTRSFR
ncbi:MAG: hypothetical protein IPK02_20280 [Candidatus Accumulibacter sp.]|uniref:Uncharacterized protein n=1 Tax=Candidatus Accumulibacter affinis TaxID=2954384 RepID=A0A935W8E1_9PROT|nr:hypothetical protein [Candidatus Accumulibacter affinis]